MHSVTIPSFCEPTVPDYQDVQMLDDRVEMRGGWNVVPMHGAMVIISKFATWERDRIEVCYLGA